MIGVPTNKPGDYKTWRNKSGQCMVDLVPHNFARHVRQVVPREVPTGSKESGQANCIETPT